MHNKIVISFFLLATYTTNNNLWRKYSKIKAVILSVILCCIFFASFLDFVWLFYLIEIFTYKKRLFCHPRKLMIHPKMLDISLHITNHINILSQHISIKHLYCISWSIYIIHICSESHDKFLMHKSKNSGK